MRFSPGKTGRTSEGRAYEIIRVKPDYGGSGGSDDFDPCSQPGAAASSEARNPVFSMDFCGPADTDTSQNRVFTGSAGCLRVCGAVREGNGGRRAFPEKRCLRRKGRENRNGSGEAGLEGRRAGGKRST